MKALMLFAILALMSAPASAATLSFTCDVEKDLCQCKVNRTGDCDAMKKNCRDGEVGFCGIDNKGALSCWCAMSVMSPSMLAPKLLPKLMQRQ